jgi:ABC-type transporter MlaC component
VLSLASRGGGSGQSHGTSTHHRRQGADYVNYKLHSVDKEWKVYDLIIEDISVVNNYQSQFDRVIAKTSYTDLVRILKEKQS